MEGQEAQWFLCARLPGSSEGEGESGLAGSFVAQRAAFLSLTFPICTMGVFLDSRGVSSGPQEGERSPAAPTRSIAALRGPCPLGASSAAVPRTLCTPAPGPSSRQIYPARPYLQGPGGPGPLFALGRGTCWADVGFPRPPSQRSQTREGAPWRLVLTAGGKWRRQVASSSAFWPSHCSPPILPTHRKGARPSPAACGWAVRVSIRARAWVCCKDNDTEAPHTRSVVPFPRWRMASACSGSPSERRGRGILRLVCGVSTILP